MTTSPDLRTHLARDSSPRLFLALWAGLAVVDVARVGQAPQNAQFVALAALAGVCSLGQRLGAALAIAGIVWLVTLGFVVNSLGVLAVTGPADGLRLALLVLAAVIAHRVRAGR